MKSRKITLSLWFDHPAEPAVRFDTGIWAFMPTWKLDIAKLGCTHASA